MNFPQLILLPHFAVVDGEAAAVEKTEGEGQVTPGAQRRAVKYGNVSSMYKTIRSILYLFDILYYQFINN